MTILEAIQLEQIVINLQTVDLPVRHADHLTGRLVLEDIDPLGPAAD